MKDKLTALKISVLLLVVVSQVFYIKHRIRYYREKAARNINVAFGVGTNSIPVLTNGQPVTFVISNTGPPIVMENPTPADSIEIAHDYFQTGLKIGFAMAREGATLDDMELANKAMRSNRVDIIYKWFDEHHGK